MKRKRLVLASIFLSFFLLEISLAKHFRMKRKLRLPRSVSEDIRNCKHWKFETSDDPHFADVHVKMHNEAQATKKMSIALQCATMNKVMEPKSAFDVPPGKSHNFAFRIKVASKFYHRDSSVREHKCQLSTWNDDAHSLVTCKLKISVWPNGLFYYKCSKYQLGQLTVSKTSSLGAKRITLYNGGERSIYLINATCKPLALTLQFIDVYKTLDKGQEWALEFPLSCSGATSMNYKGNCSVKIRHVCREDLTFVKTMKFEFMDGEIPECEHVKSILGRFARNSFAASLGVNDDWSAALAIVTIVELLLIVVTLLVKFVFVGLTKGWNSSKEEFCDRFHKFVSLVRAFPRDHPKEANENKTEDH
ncbi:uncharacterized protein LOC114956703 [Acropora millepora]|uniref:uncharacterized protein LOC114956703 n=1 Tax=Acropora millepora TaxID=45264 RepID=UPI001CF20974|nr:uncharacterized protein LOC114956703 [Acropora millepora]XP_029189726.2 uncharacterized protein LOC114956703 [Acropora millepora]XP_029189727.2 uncharacterized protein LOC114956703 [Acropora millepora]